MKKLSIVCGLLAVAAILTSCSTTKEVKELKIIHEHHIYIHTYFIASEFEAIENIDEFAHKLADYIKIKKEERKNDYMI